MFKIEKLPDISRLVQDNIIPSKDIPKLRNEHDTVKFREWINSTSTKTDLTTVLKNI